MDNFIFLTIGRKHICFAFDEILYIEANRNHAVIVDTKSRKTVVNHTLSAIEKCLPSHLFVRIHRCYVISMRRIKEFERGTIYMGEMQIPITDDSYKLLCSRLNMPRKEDRNKAIKIDLPPKAFISNHFKSDN